MFGVVKKVDEFELVVSLPNQHTAFVSCNRVSRHLATVLQAFTAQDENVEAPTEGAPTLREFFRVGDGVIGTIVSVQGGSQAGPLAAGAVKQRRRLEVSLIPAQVNSHVAAADLTAGMLLSVEITSVEDKGYVVDLGVVNGPIGFLSFGAQQQMLPVGSVVHCRIAATPTRDKKTGAVRVVTLERCDNTATSHPLASFGSLTPGTLLENVEVRGVEEGVVKVVVGGVHTGELDVYGLPLPTTLPHPKTGAAVGGHYPVGAKIPQCRVVYAGTAAGGEEKVLLLSALPSVLASDRTRRDVEAIPNTTTAVGRRFDAARVVRVDPGLGVVVELPCPETGVSVGYATVHISRLSDERMATVTTAYRVNTTHACRVIDYDAFSSLPIASMAPATLAQPFLSIESIEIGSTVRGEIVAITPGLGVLVQLSDRIRALCPTAQLTETQTPDALKTLRLGQTFKFRVLSTDASARRVLLTRKKGLMDSELPPLTSYADATPGSYADGHVASIRPFGCIVRFFGDVKAMLHKSELSDEFVTEATSVVFEGQVLRCRIVSVDRDAGSMSVSLRKTDGPKRRAEQDTISDKKRVKEQEKIAAKRAAKAERDVKKAMAEAEVEAVSMVSVVKNTESAETLHANLSAAAPVQSPPPSPALPVKAVLPSMRQLEEEELAREELLTMPSSSTPTHAIAPAPTTDALMSMREMCDEFERRLIGAPNSALLWIQYMSVLVKSSEIDAARALANRALQTISIRAEGEKLNVWTALMNLEHAYGTEESLRAVFERACVFNDSKAVHLAMARIYEESASVERAETVRAVEDFYATHLLKKFRQSCKVWMNLAQFHFTVRKMPGAARKLLSQALEALPRRKHIKATLKFAQMEFRAGSADRGRTLFEGVLASSPGRLDIWSQYCDQEERHLPEATESLRRLFTRIVSLRLSSKKAKFFFKRFLDFEKRWGDQVTVQTVKDLAQRYVESSMGSA